MMPHAAYGIEIALFWLLALTAASSAFRFNQRWFRALTLACIFGCLVLELIWTLRWVLVYWCAKGDCSLF
jgi:hypothetical protein